MRRLASHFLSFIFCTYISINLFQASYLISMFHKLNFIDKVDSFLMYVTPDLYNSTLYFIFQAKDWSQT